MTPKKENNPEEKTEEKKKKKPAAKKTSVPKTAAKKTATKKTAAPKKKKTEEIEEEKPFIPHQPDFSKMKYSFSGGTGNAFKTAPQQPKAKETAKKQPAETTQPAAAEIKAAPAKPAETKPAAEIPAAKEAIKPHIEEKPKTAPAEAPAKAEKPAVPETAKTIQPAAKKENTAAKPAASNAQKTKPANQQKTAQQTRQPQQNQPKKPVQQAKPEIRIFRQGNTPVQPQKSKQPLPPFLRPSSANKPKPEIPAIMRPAQQQQQKQQPQQKTQPQQQQQKQQQKSQQQTHEQKQQQREEQRQYNKNQQMKNASNNKNNHHQNQQKQNADKKEQKPAAQGTSSTPKIKMSTEFVVRDLAEKLNVKPVDFIKKLMMMGVFATINQRLDKDTAILMAAEYGYDLELVPMFGENELEEELSKEDEKNLKLRYPIITIMGHVDHGKTTLLDALRESNVVATEAGQITQHIGAYMVTTSRGKITVLDTPGHEAFTAMRANGVKVTDIVVLVVSAVDGVMPQTLEAINHAKAANVPIIVAVNKIDLPTANPQQIKQQLSNYGLVAEEWGGQTPMIDISAKKRLNLDKLLEIISIQAELMELKANPDKPGQAIVIEARLDPKKGVVATVIDVTGTTKLSDPFTVGTAYGKVRALISDKGDRLKEIKPGEPAEVLGISGEVPQAGDILKVAASDKEARHISEKRKLSRREENLSHQKQVSLMSLKSQVDSNELRTLNVVLKTDVFGSLQAIKDSLEKLSTPEVAISILHSGVGNVTESDVLLAKASNAIIIGFHVNTDSKVEEAAKTAKIEIRSYEIIYDLIEDVKAAMSGMLAPEIVEVVTGKAEIQQIFDLSSGKVCGSLAREGKITRGQHVHILRGKDIVGKAKITGLKRFKEDVKEVEKGLECGILLEGFKDFQIGDIIEAYNEEEKLRRLTNV